jgi:SAM-dependent methyltransferase
MGTEQEAAWYDDWYSQRVAKAPFRYTIYRLWHNAVKWTMSNRRRRSVTDLGCGYAPIGRILFDSGYKGHYVGVDFSKNAINTSAKILKNRSDNFSLHVADITTYEVATPLCILCEVLEHIEDDIAILSRLSPGTSIWASVPSFDAESHVRYFRSMEVLQIDSSQPYAYET